MLYLQAKSYLRHTVETKDITYILDDYQEKNKLQERIKLEEAQFKNELDASGIEIFSIEAFMCPTHKRKVLEQWLDNYSRYDYIICNKGVAHLRTEILEFTPASGALPDTIIGTKRNESFVTFDCKFWTIKNHD